MTYSAKNIANFVVNYCAGKGSPVSNLKLQKILYFLWVDYFKQTGLFLYYDDICAWRLGPVVPDVYYDFCFYAGSPIKPIGKYPIETDDDYKIIGQDNAILKSIIDKYSSIPVSKLVDMTHRKGSPWDIIYKDGAGNRAIIPFDLIQKLECSI